MSLLDVALSCVARGWHVFPCKPRGKEPMTRHGAKDASNDPEKVREWWSQRPDANVGIATGPSGLTVLDIDYGLSGPADLEFFRRKAGIGPTYTVRTGRRPEFGAQLYFQGGGLKSIPWEDAERGVNGDVRSATGYVLAAGSYHPSGAFYEALVEAPIAPEPAFVRSLRTAAKTATDDGLITEHRNTTLTSIAGKLRNAGLSAEALEVALLQVNADRCAPPLGEDEVKRIAGNASAWALPEAEPQILIGGKVAGEPETPPEPVDWRTRYLTFEKVRDAKPTEFLIDGFLAVGSITALAAPVAQRKSLIALNVAHALCTGEPLFDHFAVTQRPDRVVYLCPEMGLASFSTRLKQIGLDRCVGDTLFCQTMDEDRISLADLNEELPGAVVIIDTLTRFVEGDQNSSEAMAKFADVVFGLKRQGATVLLLHHSIKGASSALTLDSAMRGSTELAAFVTCCWATRLKDPDDPYRSASLLVNVKQRDFESKPFEVMADETCRMRIAGEPGSIAVLKTKTETAATEAAAQVIRDNPQMGIQKLRAKLRESGIKKGSKWVTDLRAEVLKRGVNISE
jgi:hypothetical protein